MQPDFSRIDLLIEEQFRCEQAQEFLLLFRRTATDPQAFVIVGRDRVFEQRFRVPFWHDPDLKLEAGFWRQSLEEQKIAPVHNLELSVLDPDGDMTYKVSEQDLPALDLDKDPFAQLVLDYFRLQYGE